MTASDSAFADVSVVADSDTKDKVDQSGVLDDTFAANFIVDTSVPSSIAKGERMLAKRLQRVCLDSLTG